MYLSTQNKVLKKNASQQPKMSYYDFYMTGKFDSSKENFQEAIFRRYRIKNLEI